MLWTILNSGNQPPAHTLASFTAHEFKKKIIGFEKQSVENSSGPGQLLELYTSTQIDRDYHFWERRPKTINIKDRSMAVKTLEYIHNNPLQEHWKLSEFQEDYRYSSAGFYIKGQSEFGFIKNLADFL